MVLSGVIILSLVGIFNWIMWYISSKENKKLKEQLADSQNKLLEVQDNIIVDDIKLKDVRYIIEKQEIVELTIEGVFIIDNEIYIQCTPINIDYLDFDNNVKISTVTNWNQGIEVIARYKTKEQDYGETFYCTPIDFTKKAVKQLKDNLKKKVFNIHPKQIKLSDTYSFKEEAQLVLQERKDKDFEFKLKQLEEGYNKDLDTILKQN